MAAFQQGSIHIKQKSTTQANADAGWLRVYAKSDGSIYRKDENGAEYRFMGNTEVASISGGLNTRNLTFVIDGGASVPVTGAYASLIAPQAATIQSWTIVTDVSGTATLDLWKTNAAKPTVSNTIVASANPAITGSYATSSTLTGWTTSIAANDVITVNLNSVATCKRLTLQLKVTV